MKHAGNAFKYLSLLLMLLLFPCQETLAQNGNVKGTVVADDGPVIGATVRVKGEQTQLPSPTWMVTSY